MVILLADVGGTNARLALADAEGGIVEGSITRFRGDDHPDFDSVLRHYLDAQGHPGVAAVCVAVAGPVSRGRARLTNRDWHFTEAGLAGLTGAGRVRLINDLTALGYATPALSGEAAGFLRHGGDAETLNGQRLVVNAGTGFNVCAVKALDGGGVVCLEHEEGHTRMPLSVWLPLVAVLGDRAAVFDSVEELFAGRGLARLHEMLSGTTPIRAEAVVEAAGQGNVAAAATCDLYAQLFGLLCRELALRFMPMGGLFLAGSVARSVAQRFEIFERAFLSDQLMPQIPAAVPIGMIRDDMAALQGCLRAIS